ncbi:MAG: hypothetical protein K0Q74_39 [Gammaproteobacteria bacterium]|jgi:hypothetical protein|nr:hypothetical protein [Gammaproteobacteria bacterium]
MMRAQAIITFGSPKAADYVITQLIILAFIWNLWVIFGFFMKNTVLLCFFVCRDKILI